MSPRYETRTVPGPGVDIPLRVYSPTSGPRDALVWLHGGSFIRGDLDMPEADWVATSLAERGHLVVTVEYRLANTEVRYPTPSDDTLAAWAWVTDNADELDIRGAIHLGGASAGGNIATGACMRIRDRVPEAFGAAMPATLVLAYPTLHAVQPPPSDELTALLAKLPPASRWLPKQVAAMYAGYLAGSATDAPFAAVPGDADPSGLPPTLVITSETDGLRASAEGFVASLAAHGVEHEYAVEPGTEHGHLNRPDEVAATASVERIHTWLSTHDADAGRLDD
jgi:acetyl esterase/lipase